MIPNSYWMSHFQQCCWDLKILSFWTSSGIVQPQCYSDKFSLGAQIASSLFWIEFNVLEAMMLVILCFYYSQPFVYTWWLYWMLKWNWIIQMVHGGLSLWYDVTGHCGGSCSAKSSMYLGLNEDLLSINALLIAVDHWKC